MQKNTISAAQTSVMNRLVFSAFILSISLLNKRIFFETVFLIPTSSIIDAHIIWAIWLVLRVMQL